MNPPPPALELRSGLAADEPLAVLASGGLDSTVLLEEALLQGPVVPIHVGCGALWEPAERRSLERLRRLPGFRGLGELVLLSMPTADLYGPHWSLDGRNTPDDTTADEAVYLPGRNPLLAIKPLIWCRLHAIRRLAVGTLAGNPFEDASETFRRRFSEALSLAVGSDVGLVAPLARLGKADLVRRASRQALAASFSCLRPEPGGNPERHCGTCNKCGERRRAFLEAGVADPTDYAATFKPAAPPAGESAVAEATQVARMAAAARLR